MNPVFIPKEIQNLPDAYSMTIAFIDGKTETFEIASHKLGEKLLEIVTHEDELWHWIPLTNVKRISFDKRFSNIVEAKVKASKGS